MYPVPLEDARLLAVRVAKKRPRIHVLTNPMAVCITANALVALGAEPSFSSHPQDLGALMDSADAILVNLGMLDAAREAAIETLLADAASFPRPLVLDPVMADRVPFRFELAERFRPIPRLVVKGNVAEMAALCLSFSAETTLVTTGRTDWVEQKERRFEVSGGSPLMERVAGAGCVTGAMIAAFAAIEPDTVRAATGALGTLRHSSEKAASWASGPGTFVPQLIDTLARFGG